MASYWQLCQNTNGKDQSFETSQLIRIADMIAHKWPNERSANDALVNLVSLMVQQGQIAKAESYLQRIPESADARADAELRTGVAMWQKWLNATDQADDADHAANKVDASWKSRAKELLTQGLKRTRDEPVNIVMANAMLAQAQICLDSQQVDQAMALLNNKTMGPKYLVDQHHRLAQTPLFVEQTYRTLLKVLVARLADDKNAEQTLEQAKQAMDALQASVGGDRKGQRRLMAIYVDLAKDVRRQIDSAADTDKTKFVRGFELFLKRVSESATSLNVRNWIAETYAEMASSLPSAQGGLSDEARRFYTESEQIYSFILDDSKNDPPLTENVTMQMQVRVANIKRQLGKHKDAVDWYEIILARRGNLVSVQVDAASTLQEAGAVGSNNLYELAVKGARPNAAGENVIWGWERLSKVTAAQMQKDEESRARFADVFYQARLNIARCRALQAERTRGDERAAYVAAAARAIKITEGLYPDLGGPEWQQKFMAVQQQVEALK